MIEYAVSLGSSLSSFISNKLLFLALLLYGLNWLDDHALVVKSVEKIMPLKIGDDNFIFIESNNL